ncbi:MAG: hypothetical protein K8S56_05705, partial [Candidatus Cloacimonetes bacterium]|nr:hypothetical protein [Candidatus Cloacimonadota bacterium]
MKRKTSKNKIVELVELCGGGGPGRVKAAKELEISLGYLYRLEKGKEKPGRHLYGAIVGLCEYLR